MTEKKKKGRPAKNNKQLSVSIPQDMVDHALKIGHKSASLGLALMWEEIVKPTIDGKHKRGK